MPRRALPDPLVGLQHWEEKGLPGLSQQERPMECLQEQVRKRILRLLTCICTKSLCKLCICNS